MLVSSQIVDELVGVVADRFEVALLVVALVASLALPNLDLKEESGTERRVTADDGGPHSSENP